MKVDVFDTYARSGNGKTIHFDVLVPTGTEADTAFGFAVQWLKDVGLVDAELMQSRCNFCHTENAGPNVISDIEREGYHILRMEGCPKA
jgi:Domain of unknown function (DUF2024)